MMKTTKSGYDAMEAGLLALRLGCGLFALIQGLFRFLLPALTFVWVGGLVRPQAGLSSSLLMGVGLFEIVLGACILLGVGLRACGWLFAAWSLFFGVLAIGGVVVSGGYSLIVTGQQADPANLYALFIAQTMISGLMPAGVALALLGGNFPPADDSNAA